MKNPKRSCVFCIAEEIFSEILHCRMLWHFWCLWIFFCEEKTWCPKKRDQKRTGNTKRGSFVRTNPQLSPKTSPKFKALHKRLQSLWISCQGGQALFITFDFRSLAKMSRKKSHWVVITYHDTATTFEPGTAERYRVSKGSLTFRNYFGYLRLFLRSCLMVLYQQISARQCGMEMNYSYPQRNLPFFTQELCPRTMQFLGTGIFLLEKCSPSSKSHFGFTLAQHEACTCKTSKNTSCFFSTLQIGPSQVSTRCTQCSKDPNQLWWEMLQSCSEHFWTQNGCFDFFIKANAWGWGLILSNDLTSRSIGYSCEKQGHWASVEAARPSMLGDNLGTGRDAWCCPLQRRRQQPTKRWLASRGLRKSGKKIQLVMRVRLQDCCFVGGDPSLQSLPKVGSGLHTHTRTHTHAHCTSSHVMATFFWQGRKQMGQTPRSFFQQLGTRRVNTPWIHARCRCEFLCECVETWVRPTHTARGSFLRFSVVRTHPHRTRNAKQSKWDLLMWMGVSTLHASNIKGFAFKFVGTRPVWIGHSSSFLLSPTIKFATVESLAICRPWIFGQERLKPWKRKRGGENGNKRAPLVAFGPIQWSLLPLERTAISTQETNVSLCPVRDRARDFSQFSHNICFTFSFIQ